MRFAEKFVPAVGKVDINVKGNILNSAIAIDVLFFRVNKFHFRKKDWYQFNINF